MAHALWIPLACRTTCSLCWVSHWTVAARRVGVRLATLLEAKTVSVWSPEAAVWGGDLLKWSQEMVVGGSCLLANAGIQQRAAGEASGLAWRVDCTASGAGEAVDPHGPQGPQGGMSSAEFSFMAATAGHEQKRPGGRLTLVLFAFAKAASESASTWLISDTMRGSLWMILVDPVCCHELQVQLVLFFLHRCSCD